MVGSLICVPFGSGHSSSVSSLPLWSPSTVSHVSLVLQIFEQILVNKHPCIISLTRLARAPQLPGVSDIDRIAKKIRTLASVGSLYYRLGLLLRDVCGPRHGHDLHFFNNGP